MGFLAPSQQPYFLLLPPPPPPLSQSSGFNLNNKVSPSILLIIIILAIIFFISGLLHLLVRFLLRPANREPDEMDNVTALQGQLQQLFHLHDSGVDQSFIDTLPVFNYKAIIGVKDPFDCAVCLCEFEAEDKLRLLPKCSHAFHMDCIDTWLLSHSTCPLCRASLLADFSPNSHCSPIVLVLESGSESSREINVADRDVVGRVNSHLSEDFRLSHADLVQKSGEIQAKEEENQRVFLGSGEKVVAVKLGKFRSVDGGGGGGGGGGGEGCSDGDSDARRCFSMGSFAYVMDESSSLQVPIRTPMKKKQSIKKPSLPLTPGHRPAMSECGCDSRRDFNGFEAFKVLETQHDHGNDNKSIGRSKRESFSVSKIWLRGRKDRPNAATMESSRRAFSFRFPVSRQPPVAADEVKGKNGRRTVSEIDMSRWDNGFDDEIQSCNSLDSQANAPSFARKTLLWLMGRPNKVVHSTFSSNV
ncbi:RING-H2 finger protein ATL13 [Sesamum alatum]|uniref:RING-type E3 ubiquitin transferase n=1 Tax=Sesamum alatum TaxID=300844 RepID=A0AAE2CAJ2_9LAMI|nr:RING-H2 finger protein ATL13 [Sesamum alatum]